MLRILTRCLALLLVCAAAGSRSPVAPSVFINEIHYDNAGTDAGEFVEIAGPAGTSLAGYSLVLYNGAGGAVYDTDVLSGTIPDLQNGFGTVSVAYPVNGIQNGSPDGVALVEGTTVVQFLSYEGAVTATAGPAAGMVSTDIGVDEDGSDAGGQSLGLTGSGTTYSDFTWAGPSPSTPGAVNTGQTFSGSAGPAISIDDITVSEGDAGTVDATFTVTISGSHSGVSFDIATADGAGPDAAAAGIDYVAASQAGVSIPSGVSTFSFPVSVNGDVVFEADEEFVVTLSGVTGAAVADGQGTGTIANDDPAPPVLSDVVISQVYGGGGNAGAPLSHDFVELFNRGTSAISLAGWSVQYASASGSVWSVTPLAGSIAPGGYFLVRQSGGTGTPLPAPDAIGTIAMAAASGKVAVRDSTVPLAGACPAPAGRQDFIGYGSATCFEGAAPASAASNTTAALRKRAGCHDSDDNQVDFAIGTPSPRNSASPTRLCTPLPAAIHHIQGSGSTTPLLDQYVSTSGVVTGVKVNGFFLQTPDGADDGDPFTSEGVFIFTAAQPALAAGQQVSVRGTVGEFFGLTQIESSLPGDVGPPADGALPAPIVLTATMLDPAGTAAQLEPIEAMRVHAASLTSAAPTNQFGEIATVLTGVPRPMREPGISILEPVPPDPTSGTPDCCIPRFDENPERLVVDSDELVGAPRLAVTSNVVIEHVTGPLDFSFGAYKLLPQTTPSVGPNMSGVSVPLPAADDFTVGGFNIENFAGSETRRRKAALAIRQLMRSPDVIGHVEILDLATLQTLAQQVNDDAIAAGLPDPAYQAVLIPAPAGGTQNVGFLVKTSRVRIDAVSQERASETFIDPTTGTPQVLHDRPPLVLRATVDAAGTNPRRVIVVVNHTRSFIDIELVGGEGPRVRAKRKAQAESIAGLLQELQSADATVPVIAVGDYNAYQFSDGYTDPIATMLGAPTPDAQVVVDDSPDVVDPDFVNLTDSLPAGERYTFVFAGTPQALDHVLVSAAAASSVRGYAIARGNADFPEQPSSLYADDVTRPERSSDHDMPVAFFRFPPPSADVRVHAGADVSSVAAGGSVTYTITVSNAGPQPAQDVFVTFRGVTLATIPLLPANASEAFTVAAPVSCAVADGSELSAVATVGAVTDDPDAVNNSSAVSVAVVNPPPHITDIWQSRTKIWPPNHRLVPVLLLYLTHDSCGRVETTVSVSSSDAAPGAPGRDGERDWLVVGDHLVLLRAERGRAGTDRVYTITVTATDEAGGRTQDEVQVAVAR